MASDRQLGDFTQQAEAYCARPGYPVELLARLAVTAAVAPGESVADIGAGTGLFSQLLTQLGLEVTAVEPNDAMRARAPGSSGILRWQEGTFEESGLETQSQDWVTAAQAFHWADPRRALPEIRRILRPKRCFTALWNDRLNDDSALLTATLELLKRFVPEYDVDYRRRDWSSILLSTGDFERPCIDEQRHTVSMTRQRYLDLWRSNNRIAHFAGDRLPGFLQALRQLLGESRQQTIEVPYLCQAWTVLAR